MDKLFSSISNDDIEEFKLLKDRLKDLNFMTDDLYRYGSRYKNDNLIGISYDIFGRHGSCIRLEDINHSGILESIDTTGFKNIRLRYRALDFTLEISYKDYSFLGSFCLKCLECKNAIVCGYLRLNNDDAFLSLVSCFNKFQDSLRLNFNDLYRIFPIDNLYLNWFRFTNSNLGCKFTDDLIKFYFNDNGEVLDIDLKSDGTILVNNLSQWRLKGDIKKLFEPLFKTKRYGFTKVTAQNQELLSSITNLPISELSVSTI